MGSVTFMPPAKPPPYVFCPKGGSGRRYTYYRRNGVRTKLPDQDDPGFYAAYAAIHEAAEAKSTAAAPPIAADAPGSLATLIAAYKASEEWRGLAKGTKRDYDKALEPLRTQYGRFTVATMPRKFVLDLRDKYARKTVPAKAPDGVAIVGQDGAPAMTEIATPRRANHMVNVLRLLMSWAVDRGWRKDNPALRAGRLRTGPGFKRWTDEAFAAFMASDAVSEPMKRAAALGIYTGQRKGDCLTMTRSARKGGVIEVVPAKTKDTTGVRLEIPEHPDLTRILDAAPKSDALTLLTRADGHPWREDNFNHLFAAAIKAAGLTGLSFHGLRKAASARLAEAGSTDSEIDAVLGHSDPKMTRLYRRQADQRIQAKAAITKLVQKGGKNGS
jgi:integrase